MLLVNPPCVALPSVSLLGGKNAVRSSKALVLVDEDTRNGTREGNS